MALVVLPATSAWGTPPSPDSRKLGYGPALPNWSSKRSTGADDSWSKPVIKGTRVPVELILRKIGEGMGEQQILTHHPQLTIEDIHAAAAFAADQLAAEEIILASDGNS